MSSFVRGEHFVEIGDIEDVFGQLRFEVWDDRLAVQGVKVDVSEPRMSKYFFNVSFVSQSIIWFFGQALRDKVFALIRHGDTMLFGVWEEDWLSLDEVVHFLVI